jgi:hypothetical protein
LSKGYSPTFLYSAPGSSYVYPRRKDAALVYWLETSTNLTSWANSRYVENPVAGVIDGAFEAVTNRIMNGGSQFFIRLRVEEDRSQP